MSTINAVVNAVVALAQGVTTYPIKRGPLGTGPGIVMEPEPSAPATTFFDKNTVYDLGVVLNGKDTNMQAITEAMNLIHSALTRASTYPSAQNWQITNIVTQSSPALIERQANDYWVYGSALTIQFYFRGDDL